MFVPIEHHSKFGGRLSSAIPCYMHLPCYVHAKAASEGSKIVSANLAAGVIQTKPGQAEIQQDRLGNKELFFQNIEYGLDLFLIYVITLSIFLGFLYENTGEHQLGARYALVLVAAYNVFDFISNTFPL